jgi:hypothetical protein
MGPIIKSVDHESDITIHTVSGPTTSHELLDAIRAFYDGKPTRLSLWDMSEASLAETTTEDIKAVIQGGLPLIRGREGGKTAIVAPEDLAYGLARMYQAFTELEAVPFAHMVFRSKQEALDWLKER